MGVFIVPSSNSNRSSQSLFPTHSIHYRVQAGLFNDHVATEPDEDIDMDRFFHFEGYETNHIADVSALQSEGAMVAWTVL
jgi:hypothetical protein